MAAATASGLRPVATTSWPAASAALAMSTPMPRPAPVMNQVFFSVVMASSKARIWTKVGVPVEGATGRVSQPLDDRVYACRRGDEEGDPGVPHLPPRRDHARAGWPADLRCAARPRAAPRRGRRPGRRERSVLHAPGTRRPERRLRRRAGGTGRGAQLDDAERAHLFDLARAAQPTGAPPRRRSPKPRIRPEIQWTLDAITGAAAYVGNDRLDILATNPLGRALFSELYATPTRPANFARFVFLDPRAETFYTDWDRAARDTAEILRAAAGRDPHDRDLSDLVGELATEATRSAPTGRSTTSASTPPPSSTSTTPSSASSASASTVWTSPPTTA